MSDTLEQMRKHNIVLGLVMSVLFAAMVTNLVPLGAMTWGWVDAEVITARQLIAFGGVLAMVVLVQYGSAVRPVIAKPQAVPAEA